MSVALRPMTLGEILDRTFQIYRARLWQFLGIAAIPWLGVLAVRTLNQFWWQIKPSDGMMLYRIVNVGFIFYGLLFYYIAIFLQFLLFPAIIRLTLDFEFGRKCPSREALGECWHRFLANVALGFLQLVLVLFLPQLILSLIFGAAGAAEEAAGIDTTAVGPTWAPEMTVAMLAGIAAYLWLTSCFAFSWCACQIEGLSAWRALARSQKLSRGARGRVVIARSMPLILWWILWIAALAALEGLIRMMRAEHASYFIVSRTTLILVRTGEFLIGTSLTPIFPIAITLFYYDQRIRKEGFDVELLMEQAGMTLEPALAAIGNPVQAEIGSGIEKEHPAELA